MPYLENNLEQSILHRENRNSMLGVACSFLNIRKNNIPIIYLDDENIYRDINKPIYEILNNDLENLKSRRLKIENLNL